MQQSGERQMSMYVVESNRGDFVVRLENGALADSSCVDEPFQPARFDFNEAQRVAERFSVDSNGFYSAWRPVPVINAS